MRGLKNPEILAELALDCVGPDSFDAKMGKALKRLGTFTLVSRSHVFLDGEDTMSTHGIYEWCADGIPARKDQLRDFRYASLPSWRQTIAEGGRILSSDTSKLPEDLRDILVPQGILSLLAYPILVDNKSVGFVGFDDCSGKREWAEDEVELLKMASGIVSTVYARKVGCEDIQASEDNFRRFFDAMDDLLIIANPRGRILFTNRALQRKLGFSSEELGGMGILDLHPNEKREEAAAILGSMMRKERESCPFELCRKTGERLPVETRLRIGHWDGRDCIFGISKDLRTEREALQKFTTLFESNPALMAITNLAQGNFTDVNTAFLEKLGYTRAEVIGKTSVELDLFVHPSQRRHIDSELSSMGTIRDVELDIRRKDGQVLDGLFSGEILDIQGKKLLLSVMVDISEQIELRKRLELQRRRLRNIIDGAHLGTWEWDVQTGKTIFNERWAEILGYRLAELEPVSIATWERLAHPDDLVESNRLLARHFAGESEFYNSESRMKHKDGHWVWVLDRGKAIVWNADGKPSTMFGTHMDITEKKEMEERIRQLSIRDPLTEVYNRRYIFDRLDVLAAEHSRLGRNFCVSILDIDHFKAVNDRYGHQAGDFVLKEFTDIINSSIRPYDLLGRYGGEEFIIVSTNTTGADTSSAITRLMETVKQKYFVHDGAEIRFTFSCGIADSAELTTAELTISKMVDLADRRLYAAKEGGRNRLIGP